MDALFRLITAQYTQILVEGLSSEKTKKSFLPKTRDLESFNDIALDIADAEIGRGVVLFPEGKAASSTDWYIFLYETVDAVSGQEVYKFCERLLGTSSINEFITTSHRALLLRPIDPIDLTVFLRLIEREQVSRRDILGLFARSSEARALGARVVMIPSPSTWFGRLESFGLEQPRIFVRMPH